MRKYLGGESCFSYSWGKGRAASYELLGFCLALGPPEEQQAKYGELDCF